MHLNSPSTTRIYSKSSRGLKIYLFDKYCRWRRHSIIVSVALFGCDIPCCRSSSRNDEMVNLIRFWCDRTSSESSSLSPSHIFRFDPEERTASKIVLVSCGKENGFLKSSLLKVLFDQCGVPDTGWAFCLFQSTRIWHSRSHSRFRRFRLAKTIHDKWIFETQTPCASILLIVTRRLIQFEGLSIKMST